MLFSDRTNGFCGTYTDEYSDYNPNKYANCYSLTDTNTVSNTICSIFATDSNDGKRTYIYHQQDRVA